MVRLSKTVCVIFHFLFGLVYYKVYSFAQQKDRTLSLYYVIIHFKIKITKSMHKVLLPAP